MKKNITAFVMVLTILAMSGAPTLAQSVNGNITTSLIPATGGGSAPIVKVKWEMNAGDDMGAIGTDDSTAAGAQFNASGVWDDVSRTIRYCAVVTDPDGVAQVNGVYADIFYPKGIAIHEDEDPLTVDPIGPGAGNPTPPDYGVEGCGAQVSDELQMTQLPKLEGIELICNIIRNNNNDLPTWAGGYNYDEICAADGELQKEDAYVFCGNKDLIWEDPAGMYRVDVFAQDTANNSSVTLTNEFEYLPYTGYEVDFSTVSYGAVTLNTEKKIPGDLTWGTSNRPTVRNVGNTRLQMGVLQDDMGFGTTGGNWNVSYGARLGNELLDWGTYNPNAHHWMEDLLDLSAWDELDFSILVKKFPFQREYTGTMTLDAQDVAFRLCTPNDND